jgi:hypothetical protein
VVIEGESCVLALLYGNTTFYLTSIKPFHVGDIKVSSKGPKDNLKYYGEGDMGMIPSTIPPIPLKRSRGRPYKNPNIIVFL